MVFDTHPCGCYGEAAFRHFLTVERERAARSNCSFFLLKVSIRSNSGRYTDFAPATAARLWPLLWASVRDVDFVGWYRDGKIAAAVLTQGAGSPVDQAQSVLVQRVAQTLHERLSGSVDGSLQVRVIHVHPKARR